MSLLILELVHRLRHQVSLSDVTLSMDATVHSRHIFVVNLTVPITTIVSSLVLARLVFITIFILSATEVATHEVGGLHAFLAFVELDNLVVIVILSCLHVLLDHRASLTHDDVVLVIDDHLLAASSLYLGLVLSVSLFHRINLL